MRTIKSDKQLTPVTIVTAQDGSAQVWLRTNIREVVDKIGAVITTVWMAEELHLYFPVAPTIDEIDEQFETLWSKALLNSTLAQQGELMWVVL